MTVDACPRRKQNVEYAEYLLTALYYEAIKTEAWEEEAGRRVESDEMVFVGGEDRDKDEGRALERLLNEGEDEKTLEEYRKAVVKSMGLD